MESHSGTATPHATAKLEGNRKEPEGTIDPDSRNDSERDVAPNAVAWLALHVTQVSTLIIRDKLTFIFNSFLGSESLRKHKLLTTS